MDLALVAFVVAVVLIASMAQTVAGFGFALIAVPFLVTVLEPKEVVVITSVLALLNSTLVARSVWRHVPRRTVGTMLLGSFAGMPFGLAVLLFAPADALRLIVAFASIVMAAAMLAGMRLGAEGPSGELFAGVFSGVLNTSTSMNGPPVVLYLQDRRLLPDEFRGALSLYFLASGVVSLALFSASGVVSGFSLALGTMAIPAVIIGNAAGVRLLGRLSMETFRRLVFALLIVTATAAVVTTLVRMLA